MLHSLWILAATFFTVLTYVFVKWVPPQYEIWDIFFVRSCYMAFFAVLMAAAAKTPLKTKIPKAHIGRAICGMLALLMRASAWCCSLPAEAMNCPMPYWLCFRRFWLQVQRCS